MATFSQTFGNLGQSANPQVSDPMQNKNRAGFPNAGQPQARPNTTQSSWFTGPKPKQPMPRPGDWGGRVPPPGTSWGPQRRPTDYPGYRDNLSNYRDTLSNLFNQRDVFSSGRLDYPGSVENPQPWQRPGASGPSGWNAGSGRPMPGGWNRPAVDAGFGPTQKNPTGNPGLANVGGVTARPVADGVGINQANVGPGASK